MISEVFAANHPRLVNPATSAAGERSFSTARRLKTWLRSTMTQERLSNLTILKSHKERTDRLSLLDIANEFTDLNSKRSEILVSLKHLTYSKYQPLSYYFTVCL